MNFRKTILLIVLVIFAAGAIATDVDMSFLESSMQQMKTYHYNQGGIDLLKIELQVGIATKNPLRPKVEQILIDTLKDAKTNDAKQFLCRQLRTIGTGKCVPQLESMLTDNEISHMARYALGRIQDPKAGDAIHRAIARTSGKLKVGMINSIVDLNYLPALPDIAKLVNSDDDQVAVAAVKALGYFGGSDSVTTLLKVRGSANKDMKIEIDNAMLNCAEKFIADGQRRDARNIYKEYYSEKHPEQLRIAGLKGLMNVGGEETIALLLGAINGSDPAFQKNAIAMMAELKGKMITDTLIKLSETLPPDGQELVLGTFEARGDSVATPAIIKAASSQDENVRIAALLALGGVGTEKGISTLAKAASSGSRHEREVATASLTRMKGEGMDNAFIRAVNTGSDKDRVQIVKAIGMRGTRRALPVLLEAAKTDDLSEIRREAILSIGMIGRQSEIDTLISLAIAPKDAGDRSSVERAMLTIFNKMDDRDAQARPLIAAIKTAPDDAKPVLLTLLKRPATAEAIETVRSAAKSSDKSIIEAAIRCMLDWPNTDPVEDIYRIAATSDNQIHRVLALRGYVRLARISEEPTPMYAKAMKLAKRDDEIKQVLANLGYDDTLESYNLACEYIKKDQFKNDAYMAAVKVMSNYCWEDIEKGKTELQKIINDAPNDNIRNRALRAIENMDKFKGYILAWRVAGPFEIKDCADGMQVFQKPFEPERDPESRNIKWIKLDKAFEGDRIDLQATFGNLDYVSCYARTYIWSPDNQQVKLEGSCDDFIKGWINGQEINGNFELKKGKNTFMLKLGDHGGGWVFKCQIKKPNGSQVDGLRFNPNSDKL